ncbi:DMT family transporter [Oxalobacteraceae bacterium CAVE-383]|nr:DMT family transporter [Oxalobacteraceae bacterium CAVE-383]
MRSGIVYALAAAVLFGASTPFAKTLLTQLAPVTLAGTLYFGSGLGLLIWYGIRRARRTTHGPQGDDDIGGVTRRDLPWLLGAIAAGGVAGPVLLMIGLSHTAASSASLLLNMEGVLTALLAWYAFKEHFDYRIFIGMAFIVAAGVLLSWDQQALLGTSWGVAAIVGACLCWGIDNNLTRKIAASDAVQIACIKGLAAGTVNLSIAALMGLPLPALPAAAAAAAIGFCGYGLSLVMFVLALRHLGTARTGAYFSAAPFVGAILSLWLPGESPSLNFWVAMGLMAIGIWLHLTERHGHDHRHEPALHAHPHEHDIHHRHAHDFEYNESEEGKTHTHTHRHTPLRHRHGHFPDIHHRHTH